MAVPRIAPPGEPPHVHAPPDRLACRVVRSPGGRAVRRPGHSCGRERGHRRARRGTTTASRRRCRRVGGSWPSPRSPRTSWRVIPTTSGTCSCGIATRTPTGSSTRPAPSRRSASASAAASKGTAPARTPAITPDGHYVVFASYASNLFAAGQPPLTVSVVLRWDRLTGDIVLVSQTTAGEPLLAVPFGRCRRLRRRQPDRVQVWRQPADRVAAGFAGLIYRRDIAAGTLTRGQPPRVPRVPRRALGRRRSRVTVPPSPTVGRRAAAPPDAVPLCLCRRCGDERLRVVYVGREPRLSRDGHSPSSSKGSGRRRPPVHIHLPTGERRRSIALPWRAVAQLWTVADGRFLLADYLLSTSTMGRR